jgi:hypothetical protein
MKLRRTCILLAALTLIALPALATPDICQGGGNAVVNCGFEWGGSAFPGWTLSGNTGFTGVAGAPYNYSGNYGAYLGPVGSDGFLSQTMSNGNTITFGFRQDPSYWGLDSIIVDDLGSLGNGLNLFYAQFALANFGGPINDFTVYWNGVDVGPDLVNSGTFPYTIYSGYLVGTSLPEPGTLVLFGSGILGMAGLIRRKLNL